MKRISATTGLLIAGAIFIATLLVATGLAQRFGWALIIGERSLIDSVIAFGTFVAALGTLFFLYRRAIHDDEMASAAATRDRVSRIQAAAELLASGRSPAETAGIAMASGLAEKEPDRSGAACLAMLMGYVAEKSMSDWTQNAEAYDARVTPGRFTRTSSQVLLAFCQIGMLRKQWGKWVGTADIMGRLFTDRLYLGHVRPSGGSFDGIWLQNCIMTEVEFRETSFRDAYLHVVGHGKISFINCDLTNFRICLRDYGNRPISDPDCTAALSIEDCMAEGFEVLDLPAHPFPAV